MMEPIVDTEPSAHCQLPSQAQQLRQLNEQLVPKHELNISGLMTENETINDTISDSINDSISPTGGSAEGTN